MTITRKNVMVVKFYCVGCSNARTDDIEGGVAQYVEANATLSDDASWMNVTAANYEIETTSNVADQACQSIVEPVCTNDETELDACRPNAERPKQVACHVEHGYAHLAGTTAPKKTKKKFARKSKLTSTSSHGSAAVDLIEEVVRELFPVKIGKLNTGSSSKSNNVVADCKQIDKNAELRQALYKRDLAQFVETLFGCTSIRNAITHKLMLRANAASAELNRRKHGFVSVLMRKDIDDIVNFSWESVFVEAFSQQSDLVHILLASMMKGIKVGCVLAVRKVMVKVALIYAIVENQYNPELSCMQRLLATILHNNCSDKKVSLCTH